MYTLNSAKLWFDASTVFQLRKHSPVGLTRVEANALRAALKLPAARVGFCVFDRYRNAMKEVDRKDVQSILDGYGQNETQKTVRQRKPKNVLSRVGRVVERELRVASRTAVAKAKSMVLGKDREQPSWSRGDVFVVTGGTWNSLTANILHKIVVEQKIRLAVVICDMIPILFPHQFQDENTVGSFESFTDFVARHSSLTLHISQSTRKDFETYAQQLGIVPENSQVLYLGSELANASSLDVSSAPSGLLGKEFVLSVSSIQVRKNHQLLYQLWRRFAEEGITGIPKLVLAGSPGWLTADFVHQLNHDPLVKDSIVVLNRVNDAQLKWLYSNALFTTYPSLYEGWGLPIVESLSYGKPCISSNTSSMPEAGQGLTKLLDPLDFRAWHTAILDWHQNRDALDVAARKIEREFVPRSWGAFGDELCEHLLQLADSTVQGKKIAA